MILNINRTLRMPEKTHTPTSHHHHHITHSLFNQVNPYYHELSKRLSDLFSCHHMSQKYFLSLMEFPVYIIYTNNFPGYYPKLNPARAMARVSIKLKNYEPKPKNVHVT